MILRLGLFPTCIVISFAYHRKPENIVASKRRPYLPRFPATGFHPGTANDILRKPKVPDLQSQPTLSHHNYTPWSYQKLTMDSSSSNSSSIDSTETPFRYAAYANRIRTILLSAHRYVAYTSDIGESFRPVAHPWLVRSAYGVSWTYLIGDVSHEGYKAYLRNRRALAPPSEAYKDASELPRDQVLRGMATGNLSQSLTRTSKDDAHNDSLTPWATTEISLAEDYRMVMAKRAVFQSLASMGLPAFTIHSVVRYSGRMMRGAKNTFLRTWVPIGVCVFLCICLLLDQSYLRPH